MFKIKKIILPFFVGYLNLTGCCNLLGCKIYLLYPNRLQQPVRYSITKFSHKDSNIISYSH
jgi:hypothetical protein